MCVCMCGRGCSIQLLNQGFNISVGWDFSGSPVVKTLCFHCKRGEFDPWSWELRSHIPLSVAKKIFFNKFKCRVLKEMSFLFSVFY